MCGRVYLHEALKGSHSDSTLPREVLLCDENYSLGFPAVFSEYLGNLTCGNEDWAGVLRQLELRVFGGQVYSDLFLRSRGS